MLFTLTYAVVVLLVIRCWNKPVLSPQNLKYFIIVVVGLWCVAAVVAIPLVFDDVNGICVIGGYEETAHELYIYFGLYGSFFVIAPMTTTVACVVIAAYCYTKCYNTVKESIAAKAIIRFGFFVIINQVIIFLGYIGSLATFVADSIFVYYFVLTIIELFLIITPILFIALLWHTRQKKWFCCCYKFQHH